MSEELQIKIMQQPTPVDDSDRAMFAIFDFLLADKSQQIANDEPEKLKLPKHDYGKRDIQPI